MERTSANTVSRPACQHNGCIARATKMLGWAANRSYKLFCEAHANRKPKGYWVARLEGWDGATPSKENPICIRCEFNDALPWSVDKPGHGGQLCQECEDLQACEQVEWEKLHPRG